MRPALLGQVEPRETKDPLDLKGRRDPIRGRGAYAGFLIALPWIPREKAIREVLGKNEPATLTNKVHPLHPLLPRRKKHFV